MAFFENSYLKIKEQHMRVSDGGPASYVTEKMVSLPERLVKCFWYDLLIDKSIAKTADGRRIKIFSPGDWNLAAGPDFFGAHFQIEGEDPRHGNVEIHVRSSGWKQHGHHKNPAYNNVALHVAMWNDTNEPRVISSDGGGIPQFILASCLVEDINALSVKIDMENYPYNSDSRVGLCKAAAIENPERARQLMEMAARERFFLKARRFASELSKSKFEHVLYCGLMEGMGYRKNKKPFRKLAGIVPLNLLKKAKREAPILEKTQAVEALLFGASGLLADMEIDMWEPDTADYFKTINNIWNTYRGEIRGSLRKNDWTLTGVRPANFPARRIAGVSALLAREGDAEIMKTVRLFGGRIKDCSDAKDMTRAMNELCESLCADGEGYWANHLTPGGKTLAAAPSLIGMPLARTIALNIVLPLLLGYAHCDNDTLLRDRAAAMFSIFPRLDTHRISKIMNYRMWGDIAGDKLLMKKEMAQQGMIQVFFDFCDENIRDCSKCSFPEMLRNV